MTLKLPMILRSFKIIISLFFFFVVTFQVYGEEKIDIWKNNKVNSSSENKDNNTSSEGTNEEKINQNSVSNESILIKEQQLSKKDEIKIFGIYDPEEFNLNLNMWSSTKAEDVKASIKRIKKIKLSNTSNEILEKILLSFSYPPEGMTEKEFTDIKINWLIENQRSDLIENFLKQNKEFDGKRRAVQYLVDENISKANIKEGCNKISFIDSSIKDSYLEKFKIYCLVFNEKKNEARLLLDLLREQKQSDKFFDDKINFLLGISSTTDKKVNDKNLLNFYLSSVTIKDFSYEPSKKTKKEIWKFLSSSNLIKLEDITDKEKLKNLELAANQGRLNRNTIFEIYKQIPFNLNKLINAKNVYQSLEGSDARPLIYQKFLLSENVDSKLDYLFILEDLFKKAKIQNIYGEFLSERLKEIGLENIPEKYKEIAESRILSNEEIQFGKVKYNDKILHQSKVLKFYLENEDQKKVQKDIDKIFKKIIKNKKYFFSAKDLALVDALLKDGFNLPSNFNYRELSEKYDVPKNLLQLIDKKQNAFLTLKIVEIIGEDEPHQLDSETIYFITNLLNEMNLINIRNKVIISALPQRV